MNSVTLIGRLGKDPELRSTQTGTPVCNFSLATTRKSGGKEETQWHNCVAWQKTAELCSQYLKKGRQVAIQGRIDYRTWEDKEGNKRTKTEIIAEHVEFLADGSGKRQEAAPAAAEPVEDSIPF